MTRFLDPMGLIDGTWDWTASHGGAGVAALVAAGVVALLHLAVVGLLVGTIVNARGVADAVRGFAQGVNEPVGSVRR